MYKETLQAIGGIEIFPVLSLLLFVSVFGAVLYWTSRIDRTRLSEFAQLPFNDAVPFCRTLPEDARRPATKGTAQ